jgi:DNA polymerase III epsilon subunit-like protein
LDLETTGRSRQLNEIIEIAAQVLDPFGIQIEDADFSQLVRPKKGIPAFITQLTTIDNDMVSGAEEFASVGDAFIRFMQQAADEYSSANDHNEINHVILVAHNGKVFDIPFFIQQLSVHQMTDIFFADKRFGMAIDTLQVARHGIRTNPSHGIPSAFNLPTLYQFVSGMTPELSHRALADVKATATIFRFEIFWEVRKECIFFFRRPEGEGTVQPVDVVQQPVNDDSDTSATGDDGSRSGSSGEEEDSGSESSETDNEDIFATPAGDTWQQNVDYIPSEIPLEKFKDHFLSSSRTRRERIGLQCSSIDVNTPIRAWREVFKNTLLDKIVRFTNEYGQAHAKLESFEFLVHFLFRTIISTWEVLT